MKRVFLLIVVSMAVVLSLISPSKAAANTRPYTVAEQASGQQVSDPARFSAIIGYPDQCVAGISCWTYTKGTRSPVSTYPESWYLHVDGVRVMDKVFHLYVMDPRSAGWQQQVASVCSQQCFLDGMGASALGRDDPVVPWTRIEWVKATALVAKAVVAFGKLVMPNSIEPDVGQVLVNAAHRGSTESFTPATAQKLLSMGRIWVSEQGNCLAKYDAFLKYSDRHDHFSCYELGTLPWDTSWMTN